MVVMGMVHVMHERYKNVVYAELVQSNIEYLLHVLVSTEMSKMMRVAVRLLFSK